MNIVSLNLTSFTEDNIAVTEGAPNQNVTKILGDSQDVPFESNDQSTSFEEENNNVVSTEATISGSDIIVDTGILSGHGDNASFLQGKFEIETNLENTHVTQITKQSNEANMISKIDPITVHPVVNGSNVPDENVLLIGIQSLGTMLI